MPARLVVATGNPGKLRDFEGLLAGAGVELAAHDPRVPEDADTYEGNAAIKAKAAAAATGLPALGDDSGLEVAALDGFPGLRSARIATTQPERERLLFARLAGVPRPWRARFVCVLALAVPGRPARAFTGAREGEVIQRRGTGGFGYDPVFLVPELGRTFAELAASGEKDRWSHRAAAVAALLESGALAEL